MSLERDDGMILTGENRRTRRKTCPVPLCPPQIPHGLTRERTRASAVRGRRLTTWAKARPVSRSHYWHNIADTRMACYEMSQPASDLALFTRPNGRQDLKSVIKSRIVRWVEYVACMRGKRWLGIFRHVWEAGCWLDSSHSESFLWQVPVKSTLNLRESGKVEIKLRHSKRRH
jgi:hypothetical protein